MPNSSTSSRRAARVHHRQVRQRLRVVAIVGVLAGAALSGAALITRGDGGDGVNVAEVRLVDFGFEGDLRVAAGDVRLSAVNAGAQPHNVGIRGGPISNEVAPGGAIELDLGRLGPGTYELYCDVPGHEDLGMVAPFVVTGP